MWLPENFLSFVILTALPVFCLFVLERVVFYKLTRSKAGVDWIRSKKWLHPNWISRMRYPMGFVCIGIYHSGTLLYPGDPSNVLHHLGIYWFTFWIISDITDGTIARHCDLHTIEGESIDPLSDKLLLFPPLFYFSYLGLIPIYLTILYFIIDFIGQFSRYYLKNKSANLFGKAKTFLTVNTIIILVLQQIYFPEIPKWVGTATYIGAVFLAFCSFFFKIIPNYWYANILSIMNLVCGIGGIVLVLFYERLGLAFALVFLGQFLDMFDGRAAEKWGSTPRGELLDDLADGTNFGGTISLIIYSAIQNKMLSIALGGGYFLCTSYRLIRFIIDKKKAGIAGGVHVFVGLPSPAAALFAGSSALLKIDDYFKLVLVLLSAILMVSKIPYIHFGRVILPAIPKLIKVILLTLILLSVLIGFQSRNHQILYWTFFVFSLSYVILGYPWKNMKNQTPDGSGT
ncbi:MAG: CDP-alcohol phosphatidyltransferase family protein [Deltaproteobacteria bacterium]|nr:CDP-alcohol phosphatidyltransferase family protein [Deltaproteobacteria bacterium]